MGQYYKIVNVTKGEYLCPWDFGHGAKLMEFGSGGSMLSAMALLLADGNGRGGGDFDHQDYDPATEEIIGRWSGDKIVVAGDYADDGKFLTDEQIKQFKKDEPDLSVTLYAYADTYFKNISVQVIEKMMEDEWLRETIIGERAWRANSMPDDDIMKGIIKRHPEWEKEWEAAVDKCRKERQRRAEEVQARQNAG